MFYLLFLFLLSSLLLIHSIPLPPHIHLLFSSIPPSSLLPIFILYLSGVADTYLCSIKIFMFPSPLPSPFILYLSVLGYTYLYSRLQDNLTPHVLSEWMVEVCRFDSWESCLCVDPACFIGGMSRVV